MKVADTVKSFKEVVEGKHDELPEQAFYMVGDIGEAMDKAKKLARGRLSVADRLTLEIATPDPADRHRDGRRGRGPGEPRATSACCPATRRS